MIDPYCKTCENYGYRKNLTCCAYRDLQLASYELKQNLPLIKKYAKLSKCQYYRNKIGR